MSYGQGIDDLFKVGALLLAASVPLAIWKLIDIVVWIAQHVSVEVTP